MPKPKVLVVFKKSAYSLYRSSGRLSKVPKQSSYRSILKGSHESHQQTLKGVKEILKTEGLDVTLVFRKQIQRLTQLENRFDFLVSVGGDGTLLDSSHFVRRIPILGVNSDPQRSVGRFTGCHLGTFRETLKAYLGGRLKPVLLSRLEFSLNGKPSPWLVLNDLLVAASSPAVTSRYVLKLGPRSEEQVSSGVWISTAAGSTAAMLSAGGKGLSVLSLNYQYLVREIFQKKFGVRKLVGRVLKPGQNLELVSYMKEGRVFVDGANLVAPFRLGDRLKVGLARQPLKVIGLKG